MVLSVCGLGEDVVDVGVGDVEPWEGSCFLWNWAVEGEGDLLEEVVVHPAGVESRAFAPVGSVSGVVDALVKIRPCWSVRTVMDPPQFWHTMSSSRGPVGPVLV